MEYLAEAESLHEGREQGLSSGVLEVQSETSSMFLRIYLFR